MAIDSILTRIGMREIYVQPDLLRFGILRIHGDCSGTQASIFLKYWLLLDGMKTEMCIGIVNATWVVWDVYFNFDLI